MAEKLVISLSFSTSRATPSKSFPRKGNVATSHSLMFSRMLFCGRNWLPLAASRMMPDTTGMICVTTRMSPRKIMTRVRTASSQSGAVRPLIRTLRSARTTGWPISDTTKAAMM